MSSELSAIMGDDRGTNGGSVAHQERVVGRITAGEDIAGVPDFETAFPDLWRVAMRGAFRMLGRREAAEDVAAEALARAYERWGRLTRGGDPTPWVAKVAANLAIDQVRSLARHPQRSLAEPAATSGAAGGSHTGSPAVSEGSVDPNIAERVAIAGALRKLPTRQREAVVLRYLCDISEADTAAAMGCTTGTVKQHASRGLAHLRDALEPLEVR